MKKSIILLITLFITSTLLVAVEPLPKKTKLIDDSKGSQLDKPKAIKEKGATTNIIKPMKKKRRRPIEIQGKLELLRKNFEAEKLIINDDYKENLKMLKKQKKEALEDLKVKYRKERAHLRKK